MRTKLWCGIGLLASIAAGAGSAVAADLAVKAPPGLAPAYLSDWAGFYIGINGGGGWASTTFDFFTTDNAKPSGGLFGGHAGYNWQYGSVVAGVEVDFDGADIKTTDAFGLGQKTDELASARARLGYLFFPSLLAYGTAGPGWGHTVLTDTLTGAAAAANQFGWTAGVGLEYKLVDHVLLRVEYLHYDFAKTAFSFGIPDLVSDNVKETVDTVRGGLSWKF
jgi:outer membrane immunogenic protein